MTPVLDFPNAKDNTVIIFASAGAGKTTELMRELVDVLKIYRPEEVAFATFTRRGVAIGCKRAMQAVKGLSEDDLPYFGTFHSLFFRALRLKQNQILDWKHIKRFNKMLGFNLTPSGAAAFDNQTEDDKLLASYDAMRSGASKGIYVERPMDDERYLRLVHAYETFKKENGLVDYHDVLLLYRDQGQPIPVKAAIIDEFQDTTVLQCECIQKAFGHCEFVRVAGDDYQTIFEFAGAQPSMLIDLAKKYPVRKLETSHRLSRKVYHFAKILTSMIGDKVDKDFHPAADAKEGSVHLVVDRTLLVRTVAADAEKFMYRQHRWFLLFRTNYFMTEVSDLFDHLVVPYHTQRGFCLEFGLLQKVAQYVRFSKAGYGDEVSRQRFLDANDLPDFEAPVYESALFKDPATAYLYHDYIQKFGIERLMQMAKARPSILLSTVHRVKGDEADNVVVFLDATQIVKQNMLLDADGELRLLYVACTRAKNRLVLVPSADGDGLDTIILEAHRLYQAAGHDVKESR